jgi:hypothetical protein
MVTSEFTPNPSEQALMLGDDLTQWNTRMDNLMVEEKAHIITIRGAGSVNGIEPHAAAVATEMLHSYVTSLSGEGRPVVLMFDGDEDNRAKPDVGSVFGGLVDSLQDNPNVAAICVQTKDWYYPLTEGDALRTAYGNPYETYLIDGDVPGRHAALTQSKKLANYPGYEQFFVGAAGKIGYAQLLDLSDKASNNPAKVTILQAPINPDQAIDEALAAKLQDAQDDSDKKAAIQDNIDQRAELPYGTLFTKGGDLANEIAALPSVRLETLPIEPGQTIMPPEAINPNTLREKIDNILQTGTPTDLEVLIDNEVIGVDQEDFQGRTALMLYASQGKMDAVTMLLERGAEINHIFWYQDRIPMTALDAARQTNNNKIVDLLSGLGAKSGRELS